jgi:Flp pilus assembly protein TadG
VVHHVRTTTGTRRRMSRIFSVVDRLQRRFISEDAAGPIVEFALVVPILLLLLAGVIDFSRAFAQRNNLIAAVREGARFAAVREFPCASTTAIQDRVKTYYQQTTSSDSIPSSRIIVAYAGTCPDAVTTITVSVNDQPFQPVTPLPRIFAGASGILLDASAVFRWERLD